MRTSQGAAVRGDVDYCFTAVIDHRQKLHETDGTCVGRPSSGVLACRSEMAAPTSVALIPASRNLLRSYWETGGHDWCVD